MTLIQSLRNFSRDEEGIAAIEYALIAALIAMGITVGATALGSGLSAFFARVATRLAGLTV